jgi:hypothetical protein
MGRPISFWRAFAHRVIAVGMASAKGKTTSPQTIPTAYVPRATARRDWFLSAAHLREHATQLTTTGHVDGLKRTATFYRVRDLDRVALLVHGPCGLARKRAAREDRTVTRGEKESSDHVKRRLVLRIEREDDGPAPTPSTPLDVDRVEDAEPVLPPRRRQGRKGRSLVKKQLQFE